MNGYFIVLVCLNCISLGIYLVKDGQPKEENYNFGVMLISSIFYIIMLISAIKVGF